jgi:hypothetical protein
MKAAMVRQHLREECRVALARRRLAKRAKAKLEEVK